MHNQTILVTSATGNKSSLVVPQLIAGGVKVPALVHNAEKAKALSDKGVEAIVGDMDNPAILNKAFDGAASVFFVTPAGETSDVLARNAIAAAKKAGTPCVVRLSVIKAGRVPPAHYFMQNIFGSLQTIAAEGVFCQGMGDGKLAMIDVRDIAESAEPSGTSRSRQKGWRTLFARWAGASGERE